MAIERIWDIQGFSGGESDDKTRGPKDSFYSAENVEIRTDLSGARLAAEPIDTGWNITGNITFMKNLEYLGGSGTMVCTDGGFVYVDGIYQHRFTRTESIYNRIIGIGASTNDSGDRYIYYISQTTRGAGEIHRSNMALNTFDDGYATYTTAENSSGNCVVLNKAGGIIFSKQNKIINISPNGVVTDALVLPKEESIIGITQFQNNYKIYSNVGTSGVQYYWDGSDTFTTYRQVWLNQPIISVVNDGAYDYVILGYNEFYARLAIVSGTQKTDLRVNLEANSESRLFTGNLSIRNGVVYISGGKTGESNKYGIYTYGSYYPGANKSLVQEYSSPNMARFVFHTHSNASSYFSTSDNRVYTVSHNNPPANVNKSGYIVTQVYEGNIWETKRITKIKVGFKLELSSSIKLYIRKSIGDAWLLIKTIDYATYRTKNRVMIPYSEFSDEAIGNFNTLQIKAELISGYPSCPSSSPILKRITTFMSVTDND